ncbi:MAG TPA: hypothetical protein VFU23_09560, partial [Gemmatimonadales bacterium]|nr:hypothetical protein [Gemmatimonadales bacterium]
MPSTLRHRSLAWLALTASMTPGLAAQAPLRTFLLRNAKDTIAVEQVKRTPGRLEGDLLLRSTNQRLHYVATLSPDELVVSIENEFRFATDSAGAPARQAVHVEFVGDSVVVAMAGRGAAPQRVASRLGALPWINPSFGLAEQAVRRGLVLKGEAQSLPLFALAGGTTVLADLTRVGTDSVLLTLGGVPIHLGITTGGSIRGGVIPAQGLMLDVIDGAVQN